ncbi:MAG: hypothetical protein V4560_15000 [Bacteroidota bacterium]
METIQAELTQSNIEQEALNVHLQYVCDYIESLSSVDDKIEAVNSIRTKIHQVSPMKHHPVDLIHWLKSEEVEVQRVNPNSIPPPEEMLLHQSITSDGYTMPVVGFKQENEIHRIIDGFHRRKMERIHPDISESTYGRIPMSFTRKAQEGESDRMASTIRHNRARGVHNIELMSTIVAELVEMGKGDPWICKHIGMSADELLRLKQITGLASLFLNKSFSDSWDAGNDEGYMEPAVSEF